MGRGRVKGSGQRELHGVKALRQEHAWSVEAQQGGLWLERRSNKHTDVQDFVATVRALNVL